MTINLSFYVEYGNVSCIHRLVMLTIYWESQFETCSHIIWSRARWLTSHRNIMFAMCTSAAAAQTFNVVSAIIKCSLTSWEFPHQKYVASHCYYWLTGGFQNVVLIGKRTHTQSTLAYYCNFSPFWPRLHPYISNAPNIIWIAHGIVNGVGIIYWHGSCIRKCFM